MAHATEPAEKNALCSAELELQMHKGSFMLACNFFALHHTRKKTQCTCYFASIIISYKFSFLLSFAGSQLPRHLKAQFICTSVIVSAIFLHLACKMENSERNAV